MKNGFGILSFRQLVEISLNQLDHKGSFFGIPKDIFFNPKVTDPFRINRFGQLLETPVGTAAGPHTQLSQNIIAGWLCGARYIELKTIQTLDELQVTKPCIQMQDEGYNCEWSQELKVEESFDQYLNAWILIHILKDKLGHNPSQGLGTIFNMSIGYDLKGILKENVQWFLDQMMDCSSFKAIKIKEIRKIYPGVDNLNIPDRISDNVTLSTMHGCPPDEIEKIGFYLIEERKLNTVIKLNPTLLGKEKLDSILKKSGFNIAVPDEAFEHDLQYPDAIQIIQNLTKSAAKNKIHFGLKLTNTLESINDKNALPPEEKNIYMSGRALHPIAINLAAQLQKDFNGILDISFSAGANTFNLPDIISCGLYPVTVCSDLLKPGGYGLLNQYLANLAERIASKGINSIESYIQATSAIEKFPDNSLNNLSRYASEVLEKKEYQLTELHKPDIKTDRNLNNFDCIQAPCISNCAAQQDIPNYIFSADKGHFQKAFETIFRTNPFPNTTGMICDHLCQVKCTRINYDNPLLIREIKRTVAENFTGKLNFKQQNDFDKKVAIIGAGPSGLTCAFYLNSYGFRVYVYESKSKAGGMVDEAIPSFRLSEEALKKDLKRIENSGVKIFYNSKIDEPGFDKIRSEYDFVYVSTGAWSPRRFPIEGIKETGILDPIGFLSEIKKGERPQIGKNIAVIGGGNTAMDAARTAARLAGEDGRVTILYRRTKAMMPADPDEIKAAEEEGIIILDLTLPVRVNTFNNKIKSLTCVKISLDQKNGINRPMPVEIENSEFDLEFDTVIPAIGQDATYDFIENILIPTDPVSYETQIQNIFIGGDAKRGGSTVINAIADGRKTAELILQKAGIQSELSQVKREPKEFNDLMVKRMVRQKAVQILETTVKERKNFNLISNTLPLNLAQIEASRCLLCDELCNICVTVCPNLACYSYRVKPFRISLEKIHTISGQPIISDDKLFEIKQKYQVLFIADWCNECGNCSTFCPTSGAPYRDKPKLFLNKKSFDKSESGYYFDPKIGHLYYKDKQRFHSLTNPGHEYHYTVAKSSIILKNETLQIINYDLKENQTIYLDKAAEMSVILAGAKEFWTGSNN
jgi:putative selenate reductase